jgi:hypothetical protein
MLTGEEVLEEVNKLPPKGPPKTDSELWYNTSLAKEEYFMEAILLIISIDTKHPRHDAFGEEFHRKLCLHVTKYLEKNKG